LPLKNGKGLQSSCQEKPLAGYKCYLSSYSIWIACNPTKTCLQGTYFQVRRRLYLTMLFFAAPLLPPPSSKKFLFSWKWNNCCFSLFPQWTFVTGLLFHVCCQKNEFHGDSYGLFIYSAKTCLRGKTLPRLGHLKAFSNEMAPKDPFFWNARRLLTVT
jgi:hypothetical protein